MQNDLDWPWLKQQCYDWFNDKCNDVLLTQKLIKLKDEAVTRGFDRDHVSKMIHKIRKHTDAQSNIQQHNAAVPDVKPPEELSPTQEATQANQGAKLGLRSRTKESLPTIPNGMTASGTRKTGASGGKSIVDGIL